ncbi:MAG: apolipoprotein N-acyltransferase [bacterium]|jgi:apolipoprotein N-acyltransferase
MRSSFFACTTGALLGLLGLPDFPNILLLLWSVSYFLMLRHCKFTWKKPILDFFLIGFFRYFFHFSWILSLLFQKSHLNKAVIVGYYTAGICLIVLPFWLFSSFFFLTFKKFVKKWKVLLWLSFPFLLYFTRLVHEFFPFQGFVGGELSEKQWVLENFSFFYPIIGSYAITFFIQFFFFFALYFIIQRKFKLVSLVIVCFSLLWGIQLFDFSSKGNGTKYTILLLKNQQYFEENAKRKKVVLELIEIIKKTNHINIDFVVLPESAIPELAEQGDWLEIFQKQVLSPQQSLILGGIRKELGQKKFLYFNTAYLLEGKEFTFDLYRKQFLVPFAEYVPVIGNRLGINFLLPRRYPFTAGKSLFFSNHPKIGIGICFEALQEKWFYDRDIKPIQFYLFISREVLFEPLGKKVLLQSMRAKSLQTNRPVFKVSNQGFTGSLNQKNIIYTKKIAPYGVEIQFYGNQQPSFYYQFGWLLIPLIIFGLFVCFLLFGVIKNYLFFDFPT